MEKEMTEAMIEKAEKAITACDDYFNEFAKEYGKSGFVWLAHNETEQFVVYTRGEYRQKLMDFLSTLK